MSLDVSRRSWLKGCAGSFVAASAGLATLRDHSIASAIEAFHRVDAKFKFSLAAYSYRDLLKDPNSGVTLFDFIDDCAKFQLEGAELTSYYFPTPVDTGYLHRLRQAAFRQGLEVSGTAVGNDFGLPAGADRDAQIAGVLAAIEWAAALGAPVIRIFAGHVPAGDELARAQSRMIEAIEKCCEVAGQRGIHLALENHGGPTATAEGLLSFVRAVRSPWFGVNLDTGNFASDTVYEDLAQLAPYAINVQVKVRVQNHRGEQAATDYTKIAQLLRESHYRGYVVLEFEEPGDPRDACGGHLNAMRAAMGV